MPWARSGAHFSGYLFLPNRDSLAMSDHQDEPVPQTLAKWLSFGTLVRVASVIIFLFFCVMIIRALIPSQSSKQKLHCYNNLRKIGQAIHNYHTVCGCFPPAYIADENGEPMHSWRVLILPFLDEGPLYDRYDFDQPWNGPDNRRLLREVVDAYRCPSDHAEDETRPASTETSYVAVMGDGTVWPGAELRSFADVTDGAENTILLVEIEDSGIHWMEPRDLHIRQMAPTINAEHGQGVSSSHDVGANILSVDGAFHFLLETTTPKELRGMLSAAGDEVVEWP